MCDNWQEDWRKSRLNCDFWKWTYLLVDFDKWLFTLPADQDQCVLLNPSVVAVNCFMNIWVVRSCVVHQILDNLTTEQILWPSVSLLLYVSRDGRSRAHIAIRVLWILEHFYCLYSSVYNQKGLKCKIEHMWKFSWISWQCGKMPSQQYRFRKFTTPSLATRGFPAIICIFAFKALLFSKGKKPCV